MPSQLSKTIASRQSRGMGEKSSIVPLPPSVSMPRRQTAVAASDVTSLLALTRIRNQVTSSSVAVPASTPSTSAVTSSDEASAAADSAFITARFSCTSG